MHEDKEKRGGVSTGLIGRIAVFMAGLLAAWLVFLACMAAIYAFRLG